MASEYSIWLLPESSRQKALTATVDRLSRQLGGAAFIPHVTIQGDLSMPLAELAAGVRELARNVTVQRWRVQQVGHSDHFFRYLFLEFGAEPGFDAMQHSVQGITHSAHGFSPFPHLSLAYGSAQAATAAVQRDLSTEFAGAVVVLDRLVIARSSKDVPIIEWRCLAEFALADNGPGQ